MCHYITVYVPRDADVAAVKSVLDENKFGFRFLENPHVQGQIGTPVLQILTSRKMCDCGTRLASAHQPISGRTPSEPDVTRQRKKGWSESRIRRWLEERANAAQRQEAAKERLGSNAGRETERWVRAIGQVLDTRAAGWMGVLVHQYSRGLESERIALQRPKKIRLAALTEDTLLEMNEDAMLTVHL